MQRKAIFSMLLVATLSVAGFQACKQANLKPEGLQMNSNPTGGCTFSFQNGMFVFSSWECLNKVADSLFQANENYYSQNPNDTTEFKAYESFEKLYPNYVSKRKKIVDIEEQMLENQTWSLENDPDDFSPHTEECRTLINEKGMVQVQDTIYIFREDGSIIRVFTTIQKRNLKANLDSFLQVMDTPQMENFLNSNDFVSSVEFLWGDDNCKGQVFRKQIHEYVSGRRIKCKVYVSARMFRGKFGAKTVHYTKNSRGKWKRSRAEVIYAAYAGNIFNGNCSINNTVSGVEEKRNRVKARAVYRVGFDFMLPLRVQRESFGSAHSVTHNGRNYDYFIIITW